MNKQETVSAIAESSGLSRADAQKALESFTEVVEAQLKAGQDVTLPGFGKFTVSRRAARQGRNPATGQEMTIQAATVPKFSAGSQLKKAVNS